MIFTCAALAKACSSPLLLSIHPSVCLSIHNIFGVPSLSVTQKVFIPFLAHLSRRLIGELIVYQWLRRPSVRPSVVRQHFQTSSPLKLLGQLNSYFIWRLLRMGERKFDQMVLVTWPRWPPHPYMVKTLKKSSSPEPEGRWSRDLVCSIGAVGPTKFVQMMILGWPWPT